MDARRVPEPDFAGIRPRKWAESAPLMSAPQRHQGKRQKNFARKFPLSVGGALRVGDNWIKGVM